MPIRSKHPTLETALAELIGTAWRREAKEELERLGVSQAETAELVRARSEESSTVLEVREVPAGVTLRRRQKT